MATITRLLLLFLLLAALSMFSMPLAATWISYAIIAAIGVFLLFQRQLAPLLIPKRPISLEKVDDGTSVALRGPDETAVELEPLDNAAPSTADNE